MAKNRLIEMDVNASFGEIKVRKNLKELNIALADELLLLSSNALKDGRHFFLALSGGNTPKSFFELLSSEPHYANDIPWANIRFFLVDERFVPSTNKQSNYRMIKEFLYSRHNVPSENIFVVNTEGNDPECAALAYEKDIRFAFGLGPNEVPKFDLIYLGLGEDGHTASLFPQTKLVSSIVNNSINKFMLVSSVWVEKLGMYRITILPSLINNAKRVDFVVAGADKAQILGEVVRGSKNPSSHPAQLIAPTSGKLCWFVEQKAALFLENK